MWLNDCMNSTREQRLLTVVITEMGPCMHKNEIKLYVTRVNLQWIRHPDIRPETVQLLGETWEVGEHHGARLCRWRWQPQSTKEEIDTSDNPKFYNSWESDDTNDREDRGATTEGVGQSQRPLWVWAWVSDLPGNRPEQDLCGSRHQSGETSKGVGRNQRPLQSGLQNIQRAQETGHQKKK